MKITQLLELFSTHYSYENKDKALRDIAFHIASYSSTSREEEYKIARDFYFENKDYFEQLAQDRSSKNYKILLKSEIFCNSDELSKIRSVTNNISHFLHCKFKVSFFDENELEELKTLALDANLSQESSLILLKSHIIFSILDMNNLIWFLKEEKK